MADGGYGVLASGEPDPVVSFGTFAGATYTAASYAGGREPAPAPAPAPAVLGFWGILLTEPVTT